MDAQAKLIRLLKEEQQRAHEEQKAMLEKKRHIMDEQRQSHRDMSSMLDTIREMAVAMTRLEKRLVEGETPVETLELEPIAVPPSPPPVVPAFHIPHVPVSPPALGQYIMPTPWMPMFASMQGSTTSDKTEIARPRTFAVGEIFSAHESGS